MENIRRKIRVFFAEYGRLLLFLSGIILLIIYIPRWLNQMAIDEGLISKNTTINNTQTDINYVQERENIKFIEEFVECCISRKVEKAYEMLSTTCKDEKYLNINKFKEKFVKNFFSIKPYNYKIYSNNGEYIIQLQQDPIRVGSVDYNIEIRIKIIEEILGSKIYIF